MVASARLVVQDDDWLGSIPPGRWLRFRQIWATSCSRRGFMAKWSDASTHRPSRLTRVSGSARLMKPICWIILAACVGASGFASFANLRCQPEASAHVRPTSIGSAWHTIESDRPAPSDRKPCPDRMLLDYDPEAGNEDDEAWPTLVGGFAHELEVLRFWARPGRDSSQWSRASEVGGSPRRFPIRC